MKRKMDADKAKNLQKLGDTAYFEGRFDDAITYYREAHEYNPKDESIC